MDLSIVITSYNRGAAIQRLLGALASQSDQAFQVIVALDDSDDLSEEFLRSARAPFDLKWINTHYRGYGLALARNQGILAADGAAVVILDDDSFPNPDFVAAHRASVRSRVITGGPRDPSDPLTETRMAWKMAQLRRVPPLTPMKLDEMRREYPTAYLIENNVCLMREDWIALGLFSERLKLYGFIGQEFFARAEHLGFRYQYNPEAAVTHRGEMEGDNGFRRSRKNRQIQLANLVRPSLMSPSHYRAQIEWAKAISEGRAPPDMPPYLLHAVLRAPYRLLRQWLSVAKRGLRALSRRAEP